jgi:DNA-binding transcriptional regulator YiaG
VWLYQPEFAVLALRLLLQQADVAGIPGWLLGPVAALGFTLVALWGAVKPDPVWWVPGSTYRALQVTTDKALADLKAGYEKQLAEQRADAASHYNEQVAASNQRLQDTILDYRARLAFTEKDFTERLTRSDDDIKRWETMALRSFNIAQANARAAEEVARVAKSVAPEPNGA